MKTEKDLQKYLRKEALRHGMTFDKVESRSRKGFPDCLLVLGGFVAFIELKSPAGTGVLSASQERVITDLRNHSARVWVVDSKAQADTAIQDIEFLAEMMERG